MIKPHIHVPYSKIYDYIDIIQQNQLNLEIFFDAKSLDSIQTQDLIKLKRALFYEPSLSIHAPFMDLSPGAVDPKIREVTLLRFNQIFNIAEFLNSEAVVFHSGYEKWKYAFKVEVWLEGSLITWEKLLPIAEKTKIKIAIENIFEEDPYSLSLLMEKINSAYFGVCFDTGHFNLFSKKSLKEWIDSLGKYIIEFHLHDNNKNFDEHLAIGDGTFEFENLFRLLNHKNYIFTIEAHSPEAVFKSIEVLDKLID